ncbi:substrate-binding periplasmic protein [Thalassotalea agariperforans]
MLIAKTPVLLKLIRMLVLCFACVTNAHEITAENITYYTEVYPPSNYLENNQLVGLSVETLKLMWQKMQIAEQKIHLVPWARGYRNTINNPNSMLFTMARTPEREALFKWVGPLYHAEHVLLARDDFKESINNIQQAFKYTVAAIKNDISEVTLLEQNFPEKNIARITQLSQAILMLENGRLDLMIISRSSIQSLIDEHDLSFENFKIIYSVNKVGNYYAFHKSTPDSIISQYQQAFDSIAAERQAINAKYGVYH